MLARPNLDEVAACFPRGDFEFSIGLTAGNLRAFFTDTPDHEGIIRERRKWFAEAPEHYFSYEPEADPIAREFISLGREQQFILGGELLLEPRAAFRALAERLETETILMRRTESGSHILTAGAVCFPSSWSLPEKIGKPLAEIHDPVPTVNERFAARIDSFLSRMKPGMAWERANWGLSRSPELNQHPSRMLARLDGTALPEEVFLRLEKQLLAPLPLTGGTIFALRLFVYPLTELLAHAEIRSGLARALKTMPPQIADYKGISPARERLLSFF